MKILEKRTHVVIILKEGNIPRFELKKKSSINKFIETFNFEKVDTHPAMSDPTIPPFIRFYNGKYQNIYIPENFIENRKINFHIIGGDQESEEIKLKNLEIISSLKENCKLEIAVQTFITNITFKLDKSLSNLIAISELSNTLKNEFNSMQNCSKITPTGIHFKVFYNTPEDLMQQEITLNAKNVKIERHEGIQNNDYIYTSSMPLNIENHLKILEAIIKLS